jgi:alpha-D-ribose 1-methylphosphonate 5-triphosphate diphosphatase
MVEAGLCDVLASDYFYPAMLAAVGRLVEEKRASMQDAWALVSSGPAKALGLDDRGAIETGKRADLVLVDWPDQGPPAIKMTMSAGRIAYFAER